VVSERPHQEKSQMGCRRQVWNRLQYRKVEKKIEAKLGVNKVPLPFSSV